jgi:hypothetical protein
MRSGRIPCWEAAKVRGICGPLKHDPEKLALGLDPWVDTGFPPARSPGNRLPFYMMLRRAKAGRSEKIMLKQ